MKLIEKTTDKHIHYISFALFFLFISLQFAYSSLIFSILALITLIPLLFYPILCIPVMLVSIYLGIFYMPFDIPLSFFIYGLFVFTAGLRLIKERCPLSKSLIIACIIAGIFGVIASRGQARHASTLLTSLALLIIFSVFRVNDIKHLSELLFFAAALFAIFNFALYLSGSLALIQHRLSITPDINVNSYAIALCETGILLALAVAQVKRYWQKGIAAVLFGLTSYLLFLTGSRTSAIALFIVVAISVLFSHKLGKNIKMVIFLGGLVIAATLFGFTDIFTVFLGRQGGFSGRTDIWNALVRHIIPDNFWLGIGFDPQDMARYLGQYGANTAYAHNLVLAALAQGGIFFFLAVAFIIGFCFYKSFVAARRNMSASIPFYLLSGLLLIGLAEDIYISKFFWCIMGWGLLYYNSTLPKGGQVCPCH